ncbi:MAG: peptidylprolyl isomerase [Syntrophales bacterium]|jgi:parvulin-like peptidyl-prolyl isomerase
MQLHKVNILIAAAVLLGGMWIIQPAFGVVADRIAAVVNGDVITLYELNSGFEPFQKKIESSYQGKDKEKIIADARAGFLNRMINNLLIEQEAKNTNVTVKDEEVNDAVKDILTRNKMKTEEFEKALKAEGTSVEDYRKELKNHLIQMKLVRREVRSTLSITENEIGEYYKKHRDEYEGKEAVRIKQIILLFPKDADVMTRAAIRLQMDGVLKRLQAGEPFDTLAEQYSQGPAASSGGDIGFVEKGLMMPEVEREAFRLKTGEMSGIIETPLGFHIIQVIDRRGAGIKPIESVRKEILSKIEEQKMEKKFEEWMADLRKRSHIDIKP